MANDNISNTQFLGMQLLIVMTVWFISQSQSAENALKWATIVARYIFYLLTARGLQEAYMLSHRAWSTGRLSLSKVYEQNKLSWMTYSAASAILLTSQQGLLGDDFYLLLAAFLVCQYLHTACTARSIHQYIASDAHSKMKHIKSTCKLQSGSSNTGQESEVLGLDASTVDAQNRTTRSYKSQERDQDDYAQALIDFRTEIMSFLHEFKQKQSDEIKNLRTDILEMKNQLVGIRTTTDNLIEEQKSIKADISSLTTSLKCHTNNQTDLCGCERKEQKPPPTINYGTGMACSYFEGYLKHVIPSDGKQHGFVEKIRNWENSEGVVFPVKRLLLVITQSLHCPPDLCEFNNYNRDDLPIIEPCVSKSLEEVKKDVAGVKNRRYSNTTYRLWWRDHSHPPVYVAAECATPLHTLHGVLHDHELYRELARTDPQDLVRDFVQQLQNILARSPACWDKCELVFFDDSKGSNEYLPHVLLKKIKEIEPNYLEIIARNAAERAPDPAPPPPPVAPSPLAPSPLSPTPSAPPPPLFTVPRVLQVPNINTLRQGIDEEN